MGPHNLKPSGPAMALAALRGILTVLFWGGLVLVYQYAGHAGVMAVALLTLAIVLFFHMRQ